MAYIFRRELLEPQKIALQWLLDRETSDDLPPFWEQVDNRFVNLPTNFETDKRPEPIHGGIFNDAQELDMIPPLLCLIASDRKEDSVKPQPTLFVTSCIFQEWARHIDTYTVPGALNVCIHTPMTKNVELDTYDLVLKDYLSLRRHTSIALNKQEWRRIVLTGVDSGIPLANPKPLIALSSKRQWAVTRKTLEHKHFGFLLSILHVEPFSTHESLVHYLGPNHLQALLAAISLWKDDVSRNPELMKKLVIVLQADDPGCPICISPPMDTSITSCSHFCISPCKRLHMHTPLSKPNPESPLHCQLLSTTTAGAKSAPPTLTTQ